jgi:hypothetical protein
VRGQSLPGKPHQANDSPMKTLRIVADRTWTSLLAPRNSASVGRFPSLWPCQSPTNAKDTQRPGEPQ